jgi:hypothetical protein
VHITAMFPTTMLQEAIVPVESDSSEFTSLMWTEHGTSNRVKSLAMSSQGPSFREAFNASWNLAMVAFPMHDFFVLSEV